MRKTGVLEKSRYTPRETQSRFVSHGKSSSLAFLLFTMSCRNETAAHVSAQRVLCLQSCVDKAPSSLGWGTIEEDQGTVVGLVNTACYRPLAAGFIFSQRAGSGRKILSVYSGLQLTKMDC